MIKNKKCIIILSAFIVVLSIIASMVGIFSNEAIDVKNVETVYGDSVELYQKGLYARDSVSAATQARAQDAVTLILAIPVMIISCILVVKNSKRGLLLITGSIGYFLYTYVSYAFMSHYNDFYLIYILTMILSFYGFIINISSLLSCVQWEKVSARFPRKFIGIFFPIMGFILCMMWMGRIVPTIGKGIAPVGLDHYSTLVIQSLDIGFIVPACFVTSYFIFKRNKWGYLLSAVFLAKLLTMAVAVSTMAISMYVTGTPINIIELLVFPAFTVFGVIMLWRVMRVIE